MDLFYNRAKKLVSMITELMHIIKTTRFAAHSCQMISPGYALYPKPKPFSRSAGTYNGDGAEDDKVI